MFTSRMGRARRKATGQDLFPGTCSALTPRFSLLPGAEHASPSAAGGSGSDETLRECQTVQLHSLLRLFAVPRQVLLFIRPFPINHRQTPPASSHRAATFPLGRCLDSISRSCPLDRAVSSQRKMREVLYLS